MAIPKNPMTMRGRITRCWLFTYNTPAQRARAVLPPPLEPVVRDNRAFYNVVVCELKSMRPKPLPAFVGVGYRHVAYRLYARFTPPGSEPIEGLYFLRSDADKPLMVNLGNKLTDFSFHLADVSIEEKSDDVQIRIDSPDAAASAHLLRHPPESLPRGSAFGSLQEASDFLKYKPAGIAVEHDGSVNVVRITRDEAAWRSRLVTVEQEDWAFLSGREVTSEICYEVAPIEYQWNRAQIYPSS